MITLRQLPKTATYIAVFQGILMILGAACTGVVSVNNECVEDIDCRHLGANLRCKSHLCVSVDDQSQVNVGTDTNTQSSENRATDTATDTWSGTDTSVPTDTQTDTTVASDTTPPTDTDVAATSDDSIDTGMGGATDTGQDTATDSNTEIGTDTGTEPSGHTVLVSYTFTDGLEGFIGPDSSHNAADGYAEIDHLFTGAGQTVNFEKFLGTVDWSNVTDINAVVKAEGNIESGGMQMYIVSGQDGSWCTRWHNFPTVLDWATISMDLTSCRNGSSGDDAFMVRAFGIQVHSGQLATGSSEVVHVAIDEVYIRHIEPVVTDAGVTDASVDASSE